MYRRNHNLNKLHQTLSDPTIAVTGALLAAISGRSQVARYKDRALALTDQYSFGRLQVIRIAHLLSRSSLHSGSIQISLPSEVSWTLPPTTKAYLSRALLPKMRTCGPTSLALTILPHFSLSSLRILAGTLTLSMMRNSTDSPIIQTTAVLLARVHL